MVYLVAVCRVLESGGGTGSNGVYEGSDGILENAGKLSCHRPKISQRAVTASSCLLQYISSASW